MLSCSSVLSTNLHWFQLHDCFLWDLDCWIFLRSWPFFLVAWASDRIWSIKTCFDISTLVWLFCCFLPARTGSVPETLSQNPELRLTDKSQWHGSTWFPLLSRANSSPCASVDHPAQPGLSDEWHLWVKPSCPDRIKLSPLLPDLGFPIFPLSLTLFCMPLLVKGRATQLLFWRKSERKADSYSELQTREKETSVITGCNSHRAVTAPQHLGVQGLPPVWHFSSKHSSPVSIPDFKKAFLMVELAKHCPGSSGKVWAERFLRMGLANVGQE